MKKVSEIMTKNVQFCTPHESLVTAAKIMRDVDCGSVPVCDSNRVIGMITDRDIVIKCIATGNNVNEVHCHDVMTHDVVTCSPDTDVHECARLMAQHQIRRIPVVNEKGELMGICAIGDLAQENIYINEAGEALSDISEPDNYRH
ncbi:CBS domain-containing protein [Ureibacillus acetophenoni]|uniref:CBS domain-containing protein n=2 Tax=Ureibacillus acetophenoni TaxID=614649 RepID=A0A285UA60_9BACL|nr:CBS domain-containing protein [Ureibacillus acetophenoni]SOC37201.1 CBS domain-containing protein [Ureibacillus acetophenoni]